MNQIIIEVRGTPVGKAARVRTRFGHTFLPEKTATWMELVNHQAQLVAPEKPLSGAVRFEMVARKQAPKAPKWRREAALAGVIRPTGKPDWDNLAKGVCDSLKGVIWEDDCQVVIGMVEKIYSDNPGITVVITPISEPQSAAEWARMKEAGYAD